jgi:hypothetical protein
MNDHHQPALVSELARAVAERGESTAKNLVLALLPLLVAALVLVVA